MTQEPFQRGNRLKSILGNHKPCRRIGSIHLNEKDFDITVDTLIQRYFSRSPIFMMETVPPPI